MSAVVDASFVCRAILPGQRLASASAALGDLLRSEQPVVAPHLIQVEVVSAIRRLEKRGRLERGEAANAQAVFRALPLTFVWRDDWVERALAISRAIGTSTIYDAVYLACAEDFGAVLHTCDATFCAALGETPPPGVEFHGPR